VALLTSSSGHNQDGEKLLRSTLEDVRKAMRASAGQPNEVVQQVCLQPQLHRLLQCHRLNLPVP
jgi:hypothetical protein